MSADGLPPPLAAELRVRYREAHRSYHGERHLDAVLAVVGELGGEADDLEAVRLAVWFHDAVYDPTRTDNERASAELAADALTAYGYRAELIAEVVRLVMITSHHRPADGDRNGAVISDADLAILAADRPTYDAYAAAVREEYGHVPDVTFAAGRAAVLRDLLASPKLFRTEAGQDRWERAARANLRRELDSLLAVT